MRTTTMQGARSPSPPRASRRGCFRRCHPRIRCNCCSTAPSAARPGEAGAGTAWTSACCIRTRAPIFRSRAASRGRRTTAAACCAWPRGRRRHFSPATSRPAVKRRCSRAASYCAPTSSSCPITARRRPRRLRFWRRSHRGGRFSPSAITIDFDIRTKRWSSATANVGWSCGARTSRVRCMWFCPPGGRRPSRSGATRGMHAIGATGA